MDGLITFIQRVGPDLAEGVVTTLYLTIVALTVGVILGLPAALARVYGPPWLRKLAVAYIELFRGTPLLVQLFVIYYGLPELGLTFDRLPAAFIALGMNSGAYQAEYFRGAILSISSGQMMAAQSLGMSKLKAVLFVIVPQAFRLALPSWSNEAVSLVKVTSIVYLIAVPDLMTRAKILSSRFFNPMETYLTVAVFYLAIIGVASWVLNIIEKRSRIPGLEMEQDAR